MALFEWLETGLEEAQVFWFVNHFQALRLLPDIERQLPRFAPRLRRYCERFGYPLPA